MIIEDEISHIFERFYRAKKNHSLRGTGLGLYITKRIIDAHKGKISVKSDSNSGTELTILIPQD
jgi:signal transduction histidine kinase